MGRTAIVTGATGKIGASIARGLDAAGWQVVLPVRDSSRAKGLPGRIVEVDLARRSSIERFAEGWSGPLHALVNNAAECPRSREETYEGIERQLATNVLGYLRMARAFEGALKSGAPSRLVMVASYWAGGLDVDDLEFQRRRYDNDSAYRQSKQANRMLAALLAGRLAASGVWVASCHPGDVKSKLSSDLGFGGHETPDQAADTPVWLVTADDPGPSGAFYSSRHPERCGFCQDEEELTALYERLLDYDAQ